MVNTRVPVIMRSPVWVISGEASMKVVLLGATGVGLGPVGAKVLAGLRRLSTVMPAPLTLVAAMGLNLGRRGFPWLAWARNMVLLPVNCPAHLVVLLFGANAIRLTLVIANNIKPRSKATHAKKARRFATGSIPNPLFIHWGCAKQKTPASATRGNLALGLATVSATWADKRHGRALAPRKPNPSAFTLYYEAQHL